jgi:hypothetical protein
MGEPTSRRTTFCNELVSHRTSNKRSNSGRAKKRLSTVLNEFLRHTVQDILTTRCAANRDAKVALFEVGSHPKIHDAKQLDLFC